MGALGEGEAARRYYEDSLEIRQRLAQAEPQRADYQRDLVLALMGIAATDPTRSSGSLQEALEILCALRAAGREVQDLDAMIHYCEQALRAKSA